MSELAERPPAAPVAPPDLVGVHRIPASRVDVEARRIAKRFGATPVFEDVSFRLPRGGTTALVGANGTGKSTLLRCIMGLLPVCEGEVRLLDEPATGASDRALRALRARIGLVSQKHNLVPRLSVLSNVVHGLLGRNPGIRHWSHGLAPAASRHAAMTALRKVGLEAYAQRRADRLSGGQSQRVAIARAIVGSPEVLFADEPCASLDPSAGADVMELFHRLAREEGVTLVFTSHSIEHALRYGDRVMGLNRGGLELDAPAADLTRSDLRGLYD